MTVLSNLSERSATESRNDAMLVRTRLHKQPLKLRTILRSECIGKAIEQVRMTESACAALIRSDY